MTELSLHILDIAQNSIKANATLIEIIIDENVADNLLTIEIIDNGCGMDEEFLSDVTNPFRTTRTTRKVGLGLSLFKGSVRNNLSTHSGESALFHPETLPHLVIALKDV